MPLGSGAVNPQDHLIMPLAATLFQDKVIAEPVIAVDLKCLAKFKF